MPLRYYSIQKFHIMHSLEMKGPRSLRLLQQLVNGRQQSVRLAHGQSSTNTLKTLNKHVGNMIASLSLRYLIHYALYAHIVV